MTETVDRAARVPGTRPAAAGDWRVVAEQECRDLWIAGRGPALLVAYSVLLSATTYLAATNQVLNFLEQREAVSLTVQIATAVGVLVTVVVSADAISGERERGTLEGLLLTPASRREIVLGKLVAAVSPWFGAFVVSIPYVWVLGRGVSVVGPALAVELAVGTLLAVAMASLGLFISARTNSPKVSVAVSVFILLALFAPTQLPSGPPQGWFGALLTRLNPVGSGLQYVSAVLVRGHAWTQDLSYLVSPALTAALLGGALVVAGERLVGLDAGTVRS
jgi:ABC-2 type transport system permease protein